MVQYSPPPLAPAFLSVSKLCHLPLLCVSHVTWDLEDSFLSEMALPAAENAGEYSQFENGGDTSAAENNIIAVKQSLLLRLPQ